MKGKTRLPVESKADNFFVLCPFCIRLHVSNRRVSQIALEHIFSGTNYSTIFYKTEDINVRITLLNVF